MRRGDKAVAEERLRKRARVFAFLFSTVFFVLIGRLAYIQLFQHSWYLERARIQHTLRLPLPACRGEILDRKGRTLATTIMVDSVFAEPRRIQDISGVARSLAWALDLDPGVLAAKLKEKSDKGFIWIKRKVSPEEARRVKELGLEGVGLRKEPKRVYPQGVLASHILGFVDIDCVGLEGAEKEFNRYLTGRDGFREYQRDGRGRLIYLPGAPEVPASDGDTLVLTIDSVIQHFAEEALDSAMETYAPMSATAIVLEPFTGEVLALANRPAFDPNRPGEFPPESRLNRAIVDIYEPGSTFKPVVLASAIEEGLVNPSDRFFCYNGVYQVKARRLHDHRPHGWLTVRDILVKSSNIGMAQIGQLLGAERMYAYVRSFAFGEKTGIELPAEAAGKVYPLGKWSYYSVTSVPMGQEIGTTPLQLARAFCVFANGGFRVRPTILKGLCDEAGKVYTRKSSGLTWRVISPSTARTMVEILTGVVEEGTGRRAKLQDYVVAGKTGTSQKVVNGTYSHSKFVTSFVCFAPAERPRVLVLVMVNEPTKGGSFYGGTVAAPLAARVLEETLHYLGVRGRPRRTVTARAD